MFFLRPAILAGLLFLAACAQSPEHRARQTAWMSLADPAATPHGMPRIVKVSEQLECVPYARAMSGIPIRGNAWTWWNQAEGRFRRAERPAVGAVMVLSRTKRLTAGHLAVVSQVLDSRRVVVRHANWLNKGRIHLDTPVHDVSPDNDWSMVRVWYTPGRQLGARSYAVSGFILPERLQTVSIMSADGKSFTLVAN